MKKVQFHHFQTIFSAKTLSYYIYSHGGAIIHICFPLVVSSHGSGRLGSFCTSSVFWSEERGYRHPAKGTQGWLPKATDALLLCDTPC